jgi:hypothetical protein
VTDPDKGGMVAADSIVWRNGLGTTYTQTDYNTWRANFGRSAAGAAAVAVGKSLPAVPEPSTVWLVFCALAGALRAHTSRRRIPRDPRTSTIRCALVGTGFKSSDFLLELIDPLLERTQGQFSNVLLGRRRLLGFCAKLLKFQEFCASVLQLASVFDGHGTTSTIPFGTKSTSVAKVLSVNCRKPSKSTSSRLINGIAWARRLGYLK